MPEKDPSRDYELVDRLVEEFADRYARGQRPSVQEYCDRYPDVADLLRDLLPAMVQIEQVKEGLDAAAEHPAPPPVPPLEQLGDFHILREIGRGGMGVVYEAEQVSLGRRVALKVLSQQMLRDTKQKRRFEREAKAAARLHHTNIVPVFGTGEHTGTPYYVMQYIQGLGLDAVIEEITRMTPDGPSAARPVTDPSQTRRDVSAVNVARSLMTGEFHPPTDEEPPPADDGVTLTAAQVAAAFAVPVAVASAVRPDPSGRADTSGSSGLTLPGQSESGPGRKPRKLTYWQSVARVGVQVADALDYAHKQGVVHRDVKPSNLLLDLRGTVWVTDFGLAKAEGADNLTHTGDVLGTLRYMPPEAFDGRSDVRGDVYSLGLTLYELAALRPAFDERNRQKLIKQVTTEEPPRLQKVRPEVPRDLATIIEKAIEKDPERRYSSAAELEADLQRFVDDEPILARRLSAGERVWRWCRHHPAVASLIAFVAVLMTAVTIGSLLAAGHFNRLRWNEARAASSEREAKEEARRAEERERKERQETELARKAAEESKKRAEEALRKGEEHYAKARAAVNDYLTAVGEDERLRDPGFQELRAQLLQSALGFYQDFLKDRGEDPTLRRELAHVYYRVGQISADLGQTAASQESYAQARRLYEALAAEAPDDPDLQDGVARCLARAGRRDQAIAIWEKIVRPDDPRYQADLGNAYNTVGLSYQPSKKGKGRTPDRAKALEFHLKALAVRERLVALRPSDAAALRDLAGTVNNIALLLSERERGEEALALYRRAAGIAERAYNLQPTDRTTSNFYATILGNIWRRAKELGHPDEGHGALRRRVEVLDRRARDNPDSAPFATEMTDSYRALVLELAIRPDGRDEAARIARRVHDRIAEVAADGSQFFQAAAAFHAMALGVVPAGPARDQLAVDAIAAFRNFLLAGGRGLTVRWTEKDGVGRWHEEFKALTAREAALRKAEARADAPGATADAKLAARREVLATLEALAGPNPAGVSARRHLLDTRAKLGRAYLDAGRVEEARAAFDEVVAGFRRLVEDNPKNEQFRIELAAGRVAAGDAFAAAGRLGEAVAAWGQAVATLEEAHKANPVSVPARTALAAQSLHVGGECGRVGLWDRAAGHYRRAFEVQPPADFAKWFDYAMLMLETGDAAGHRALGDRIAARIAADTGTDLFHLGRAVLLAPDAGTRHARAVERVGGNTRGLLWEWGPWCRAVAALRRGSPADAVPELGAVQDQLKKWPALALALHHLGRVGDARAALKAADDAYDARTRAVLTAQALAVSDTWWADWLLYRAVRREAHRAVHGTPLPESPYDRLHCGRLLLALGQQDRAEAEFAAAVAPRPDDAEVWLTRSAVFARLGLKDRAVADIEHALRHKATDPRGLIEAGRTMTELGGHTQADAAFARAASLAPAEPGRYLEHGWWVVGPYPDRLDLPCPPELNPDPSRPVPAVGRAAELKWVTVSTTPHTNNITLRATVGTARNVTYYALAYVYADRDRTAIIHLRTGDDARLWINGRVAFDGFAAWGLKATDEVHVPVTLKAGRNTLLVKTRHVTTNAWCECGFDDTPARRAISLAGNGQWSEAADKLAEAERQAPLDAYWSMTRARLLLAAGRDDEYRRVFAEMATRFDTTSTGDAHMHLGSACWLPPERSAQRDRWVNPQVKRAAQSPKADYAHYWLGHAYYRAGRFNEAEASLRKAVQLSDALYTHPLLASTLHQLGRTDEARRVLTAAEERYDKLTTEVLAAQTYRLPQLWSIQPLYLITWREARTLIDGKDPGPNPHEAALRARGLERKAQVGKAEDRFAQLVDPPPTHPRPWIDRGRRLGELGRWDEAAQAMAKATELAPKDTQVWKERGRVYAELGKWDEAAADFAVALDLAPIPKLSSPQFPWRSDRRGIDDLVVRWDEVFDRVMKQRPKDAVLMARRAQHCARLGKWREAETALLRQNEIDPGSHWGGYLAAPLMIERGAIDDYRRVCAQMLERFTATTNWSVAEKTAVTCLLATGAVSDITPVRAMLDRVKAPEEITSSSRQLALARALAAYRAGDPAAAVQHLSTNTEPKSPNDKLDAYESAVLAMARHAIGQQSEARAALARARGLIAANAVRPDRGGMHDEIDWHDWVRCRLLVREAEKLIPDAPAAAVAGVRTPAEQVAARHKRKARAERVATDFALALLRLEVGQKSEAEAGLRAVVEERGKLATEEPENSEYQSRLAAAHLALGRLLADTGRLDDAAKELAAAGAIREKLVAVPPGARQLVELAEVRTAQGDLLWQAGRHAEAVRVYRVGIEQLETATRIDPKNVRFLTTLGNAEIALGNRFGEVGLWAEAGELLARPLHRGDGDKDHWHWLRAAQAILAAGDVDASRKLADEAVLRFGTPAEPIRASAMSELLVLVDRQGQIADRLVQMAERAAVARPSETYLPVLVGMHEYRAGRFAKAIERLDTPKVRDNVWAKAFLAMAHYRLGNADQARDWLAKAADEYTTGLRNRVSNPVPTGGEKWWLTVNELIFYREAHELIVGRPLPTDPLEQCCRAVAYHRIGEATKADAELRAVAEGRENDPAVLTARGVAYARMDRWDAAAADLDQALTLKPDTDPDWWRTGGLAVEILGGLPDEAFDRLAARRPTDRALLARRMKGLAARGRFRDAAVVQAAGVKLDPSDESAWHQLALLRLQAGDTDGYRAACRELIARFPSPTVPDTAERMITTCLLVPDLVTDRGLITRWADAAMAGYEKEPTHTWLLFARVLADHRLGDPAVTTDRIARLWKPSRSYEAAVRAIEAVALERQGKHEAAVEVLKAARAAADRLPRPDRGELAGVWWDLPRIRTLLAEAEEVVTGTRGGTDRPTGR